MQTIFFAIEYRLSRSIAVNVWSDDLAKVSLDLALRLSASQPGAISARPNSYRP